MLGYNLKSRRGTCGCGQVVAVRKNPITPGTLFGKLTVLGFSRTIKGRSAYRCICSCGKIVEVKAEKLKSHWTESCGCLKEANGGDFRKTHGFSKTAAYRRMLSDRRRLLTVGLGSFESFTVEDVLSILTEQNYVCFYCERVLFDNYHIDHKIPLSRGGTSNKENLCAACPSCNLKKKDKTAEEFLDTDVSGKGRGVAERKRGAKNTQVRKSVGAEIQPLTC